MNTTISSYLNNVSAAYLTIIVVLLSILYYVHQSKRCPPGPTGLPFFGYYPFLDSDTTHLQLHELGRKYGDVFSFTVMGRQVVSLGSIKALKEAFVTKAEFFASKPEEYSPLYEFLEGGVLYLKGEHWKVIRKFLTQQFRERGMTSIRETLSGPMYDTIREIVVDLKQSKGEPVNISTALVTKCGKIMRQTLFGDDGMTDQEMQTFVKAYFEFVQGIGSKSLLLSGNFAKYFILGFSKAYSKSKKNHSLMENMLQKVIDRRRSTFDETNIRDAIDAYLKEKKDRMSKNDPTAKYFTDKVLIISLIQIVGDGVLVVALFVGAFISALLEYPEEQDKIHKELLEVVGVDRDPRIEDKSKLSYTNAFISEVERTTDIITFFPSLECTKETTVCGQKIPKGAITIYNFWSAHRNPKDYEEPLRFNPSRFIVKEGKKRRELVTFGVGKRACLGEGFTMIQVFLYLTTVVKNFQLSKPNKAKENVSKNVFDIFGELYVCAHPRN